MRKRILVRGAGDIATGIIQKLYRSGFDVLAIEIDNPSAIRRQVALCEAVHSGQAQVEDVIAQRGGNLEECLGILKRKKVAILVDPEAKSIGEFKPEALVDAILAKRNLGTKKDMAPTVIGIGPGFCAGEDVDVVVETQRGHRLGRLIFEGSAQPNTGIPGIIQGIGKDRVLHSPADGILHIMRDIGSIVKKGEIIAYVDSTPVIATIDGLVRGMIREGFKVKKGLKIADIDPRKEELENCFLISDKARSIGGAVLEAILWGANQNSDEV